MFMLICLPVNAATMAAQVILSKGIATATTPEGEVRPLKRRSKVFSGDVIKTGPKGSLQLRFVDKALMTIKASTEMNIANYLMRQAGSDEKEEVLMKLVKGGFRTITGSIGKGNKSAYRVDTPAASIGIRGTNYEVQQELSGDFVMAVYSGGISVANEAGTLDLGLGADFNFTRVSLDKSPQGLLEAPESLSVNAATENSQEESEDVASTNSDDSSEEAADSEEATDANNDDTPATEEQSALLANVDLVTVIEQAVSNRPIEPVIVDPTPVITPDTPEPVIVDPTPVITPDTPEPVIEPSPLGLFEFDDAYAGLTDTTNKYPTGIITDDQYNLAASEKLAMLVVPLDYSIGADKRPTFNSLEPQLTSSVAIDPTAFIAYDYSATGNDTTFTLRYELLDTPSNNTTHYELNLVINGNITSVSDLEAAISAAIPLADVYVNGSPLSPGTPIHVQFSLLTDASTGENRFEFKPNSGADGFITEMALNFQDENSTPGQMLLSQLGSSTSNEDDWHVQVETEVMVSTGSWNTTTNSPIYTSDEHEEINGQNVNSTHIAYKDANSAQTVSSLAALAICGDNNIICDIQKDNVKAGINIRWGAWLAEPPTPGNTGESITINEITEGENGNIDVITHEETTTLAFWIAAERADINTLTGTASFGSSGLTDCTDYSQCIGFADDGGVKNVNGKFDVNFNNGAISNGLLQVQTAGSDITKSNAQILSNWEVNFNGQLSTNPNGTSNPEFESSVTGGTIKDGAGNAISNNVIGNVGGIFVKPGTVFAGGYNLSTADENNKHAAGVFTLQKEP
jgi:hypothetical protein